MPPVNAEDATTGGRRVRGEVESASGDLVNRSPKRQYDNGGNLVGRRVGTGLCFY